MYRAAQGCKTIFNQSTTYSVLVYQGLKLTFVDGGPPALQIWWPGCNSSGPENTITSTKKTIDA